MLLLLLVEPYFSLSLSKHQYPLLPSPTTHLILAQCPLLSARRSQQAEQQPRTLSLLTRLSQITVEHRDQPEPPFTDQTPILSTENTDLQDQLNQGVANTLGVPVQLTDSQFNMVLEQLAGQVLISQPLLLRPVPLSNQSDTQPASHRTQMTLTTPLLDSSSNRSSCSQQS